MSKKAGRLIRWKRNEERKRKRHNEVMRMLSSYDYLEKSINIDMNRLFGR